MAEINKSPGERKEVMDPWTGQFLGEKETYSFNPGTVGRWDERGEFIPSKFDFSNIASMGTGSEFAANTPSFLGQDFNPNATNIRTFALKDGSSILYDASQDKVIGMSAPASAWKTVSGEDLNKNFFGYPTLPEGNKGTFQGVENIPMLYEPRQVTKTGQYLGGVPTLTKSGGFDDWITENGWMIPAAMLAAGGAVYASGAGAAGGGAGAVGEGAAAAGGMDAAASSYLGGSAGTFVPAEGFSATLPGAAGGAASGAGQLAGPTYGELGYTGVEGGFAGPTYAEMGYTGLNNAEAIAAADAASKGLTGAEALKYANQARQGLSAASTLSKLLGGSGSPTNVGKTGTSGLDLSKLASLLGGGQQTNSFVGQIKGNENPFLFTTPGQTQAAEGTYDVSGANLANALRKA